ncbi:MAG: DUF2911 domain-containing protein [Deltaproteobacteria bacterium]|nr:DUF2911 domain-containing protein [Deltaproteobacteria bacterium]MCW5802769.1 DUF2911 domain-containing protein [Deltaproteobacteria bacterium]
MRKLHLAGLLVILTAGAAHAQALELPQASPKARTEQRVGLTDLAIDYSSPAVKKRVIWGDVVPYDKTWRAGANAPTRLTVSTDFKFGGTQVKAGSYALFVMPARTAGWIVALSTDFTNQLDYDPKKDVARYTARPVWQAAPRERLLWYFTDTRDDGTSLDLEWERVRVRIPIELDTAAMATAAIDRATGEVWRPHFQSANYLYESGGDLAKALALVDRSIALNANWRNEWLRARIQHKKGDKAEATASATRAQTLGKGDKLFDQFFKDDVAKAVAGTWK